MADVDVSVYEGVSIAEDVEVIYPWFSISVFDSIGIEDGIYDVLNPKTNRLHRVTKQQIEQIDQAKAKHTRSRASLRSNEDTYPKGTEFAKGGDVKSKRENYNHLVMMLKKNESALEWSQGTEMVEKTQQEIQRIKDIY